MIHHIGEPRKSFIVVNVNYSDQEGFEIEARALASGISIGEVFNFHFHYNTSNEVNVKYELVSLMINSKEVNYTLIDQLFTCRFKVYTLPSSHNQQFYHSDVISSLKISGQDSFAAKALELELVEKYLSAREIDRIPKRPDEKLFMARIIGENIPLGQKFDIAWVSSKGELLFSNTQVVAIYSRSNRNMDELISGLPSLVKLKFNDSNFESINEPLIYLGVLI